MSYLKAKFYLFWLRFPNPVISIQLVNKNNIQLWYQWPVWGLSLNREAAGRMAKILTVFSEGQNQETLQELVDELRRKND